MVRDLWQKGFTKRWVKGWWMEKVEKRRMDWDKHKEAKLVQKVKKKFIPEMRRGILKRAMCDIQRRSSRRTSKCDNIRGTSIIVSLKKDENLQVVSAISYENKASTKPNITQQFTTGILYSWQQRWLPNKDNMSISVTLSSHLPAAILAITRIRTEPAIPNSA